MQLEAVQLQDTIDKIVSNMKEDNHIVMTILSAINRLEKQDNQRHTSTEMQEQSTSVQIGSRSQC